MIRNAVRAAMLLLSLGVMAYRLAPVLLDPGGTTRPSGGVAAPNDVVVASQEELQRALARLGADLARNTARQAPPAPPAPEPRRLPQIQRPAAPTTAPLAQRKVIRHAE